jgi:hypothetical protein
MSVGTHIFILELQSGDSRRPSMWYGETFCLSFTRTPKFQHTLLQTLFVMPIGCDHTSIKASDPIKTQMLNVLE